MTSLERDILLNNQDAEKNLVIFAQRRPWLGTAALDATFNSPR